MTDRFGENERGRNTASARAFRLLLAGLVALVTTLAFGTAVAGAATVNVETTGTDSPTCGAPASPCLTINYAVNTVAAAGDLVQVGPGTFVETPNGVKIDKPLTLRGTVNGTTTTTISGGLSTTASASGTIRITAPGNVTVRNFNVEEFVSVGTPNVNTANKLGLMIRPPAPGGDAPNTRSARSSSTVWPAPTVAASTSGTGSTTAPR